MGRLEQRPPAERVGEQRDQMGEAERRRAPAGQAQRRRERRRILRQDQQDRSAPARRARRGGPPPACRISADRPARGTRRSHRAAPPRRAARDSRASRSALAELKYIRLRARRTPSVVTRGSPLRAQPCRGLGEQRDRQQRRRRQAEPGRPPPDQPGDQREDLAERQVLAAQDVALADPAALEGQQVAGGDVVDVDHVEAGVDIGRHAPARRLQHHPPGRGRARVARADRRRRVDDHRRQAVLRGSARAPPARRGIWSACSGRSCRRAPRAWSRPPAGRPASARASRRCWCRRSGRTPASAAASSSARVPSTLVRYIAAGSGTHSR